MNTLIIVGSGIKFMSHLTTEAKASIENSDKVLYLVNDPLMQEWIKTTNSSSESLDTLYANNASRNDNYRSISEYIIENLKKHKTLCVVVYGHPTVFVQPTLYAAESAKKEGFNVVIMPGISAEDCLFADLLIDPGSSGCQSYEATDFLLYQRNFDPCSHLILWQPYVIGVLRVVDQHDPVAGLNLLVDYLSHKYTLDHQVIVYEAAQYPTFKPRILNTKLKQLPHSNITRLSTLYIPPIEKCLPNQDMLAKIKKISLL